MKVKVIHNGIQTDMPNSQVEGNRWLVTFNDMITLLMVFFVLLFSMGSMDVKRFKHFQNALQSTMGVLHEGHHAPVGIIVDERLNETPGAKPISQPPTNTDGNNRLEDAEGLEAEYTSKGIHLTLDDRLLFPSGSAQLTADGEQLIKKVARVIKPLKRTIRVEGHTDNNPIATTIFPSNWELSTARAVSVVKFLIDEGGIAPEYLSAAGYGDSRPRVPNESEFNRSKNRRVEIILGRVAEPENINGGNPHVE